MEKFIKGDVVVVPFPFSDLTQAKRRPALVLAILKGDDVILCQITSKNNFDDYTIKLEESDFSAGSLNQPSNIRPNRIFTADRHIILYRIGNIIPEKMNEVIESVVKVFEE
ncbi:MAG: type II toxin-antitoxin system PemK/MazF family toxin [Candidatus Cloacimonetes bacterium]|nr:type II toxin-antitoxin system PemK/MazF family toxin [Candidatus Cloacimonadota bacterium]